MKNPDAPFLELAFYFSKLDGNSALKRLTEYLLGQGAVAKVAFTTDRRNSPLAGFDFRLQERRIDRSQSVLELLRASNITTTKIAIEKGTQVIPNTREFVVQLPIDKRSIDKDHNPVAIWIEGEAFSYAPTAIIPAKARRIGGKALRTFREIVLSLSPAYGAITVDYGLECPTDLKYDSRTHAFLDFYVSTDFVGEGNLSLIKHLCSDAYHETMPEGQITCCSGFFAPIETNIGSRKTFELSEKVGRIISHGNDLGSGLDL